MDKTLMKIYKTNDLSMAQKYVNVHSYLMANGYSDVAADMDESGITTYDNAASQLNDYLVENMGGTKNGKTVITAVTNGDPHQLYYSDPYLDHGEPQYSDHLIAVDDDEIDEVIQNAIFNVDVQKRVYTINRCLSNLEPNTADFDMGDLFFKLYANSYDYDGNRNLTTDMVDVINRILSDHHVVIILDDSKYNNFELDAFHQTMGDRVVYQTDLDFGYFEHSTQPQSARIECVSDGKHGVKGAFINDVENAVQMPLTVNEFQTIINELKYQAC